jgi:hypothetical protein
MGKLRDAECHTRLVIEVIEVIEVIDGPNWNSVDAQFAISHRRIAPVQSADDHKTVMPNVHKR